MSSALIKPVRPTAEEVYQQLERILSSEEFHSPERGRRFLEFIINETLEGRSEFLKAFTIANEVFGRQVNFDAQNDRVVRIEAGRVRRALERYYLVAGQMDSVTITIPKGGYRPYFEYTDCPPSPTLPTAPVGSAPSTEQDETERPLPQDGRPIRQQLIGLTLGVMPADVLAKFIGEHMLEHASTEVVASK